MSEVRYTLTIDGRPLPDELLDSIQELTVEDHDDQADMLRLRLGMGIKDKQLSSAGWTALDDKAEDGKPLFRRLAKVLLTVQVGKTSMTLFVGYVIDIEAIFSNQPDQSTLDIVAMDPTVMMFLDEVVKPWPNMADSDIATTLFNNYELIPKVKKTQPVRSENKQTTIQQGTDIQFLRYLAKRNGYLVYVETSSDGQLEGHFHPPSVLTPVQGVLNVFFGEKTNVNSFRTRHEMLRPAVVKASGLDIKTRKKQSVTVRKPGLKPQGKVSTLELNRPRIIRLSQTGLSMSGELQTLARAEVDRLSWSITAEGDLHTVAYGGILRAKRPILVRGAGGQFSGYYYVKRVRHQFTGDSYTQHFTLKSNALGLKGEENFTEGIV